MFGASLHVSFPGCTIPYINSWTPGTNHPKNPGAELKKRGTLASQPTWAVMRRKKLQKNGSKRDPPNGKISEKIIDSKVLPLVGYVM